MTFADRALAARPQRGFETGWAAGGSLAAPVNGSTSAARSEPPRVVEVTAADLPLACPRAGDPVCFSHPRIYLDILNPGEAQCPYCATLYRLRAGEHLDDHHFGGRDMHQHRPQPPRNVASRRNEAQKTLPNAAGVVDARGRTTLAQITDWLRGERR
jgi:uncharacterized Zn-finger protein